MNKNDKKALIEKIRLDLEKKINAINKGGVSSPIEDPLEKDIKPGVITEKSIDKPIEQVSDELIVDSDDTNLVTTEPEVSVEEDIEFTEKQEENIVIAKKSKTKKKIPYLLIILSILALLALGYMLKLKSDLKKKIELQELEEEIKPDYKVKDIQFKDVKDDFSETELQDIDVEKKDSIN